MTDDLSLLLPYQSEALRLSAEHQLLVIEKSRRTGITYGFGADAVLTAAAGKGGMDVFYIAYNLDMTREFIDYCSTFAKAFDRAASAPSEILYDDGSEEGIKAFRIDFPSGHSIVALSSKPRSLRGKQGKVIIDEAAFVDSLAELLKAPSQRASQFFVGSREFDPQAVGLATARGENADLFDTRLPGNSNAGHAYGTELADDAKRDLLEYLKSL